MIQLTPQMRILLAVEPTDFRKGIDGLGRVCREALRADPLSGAVFVFRNRCAKALKVLVYDGQGFWLCQKRLSAGRFGWWPKGGEERAMRLSVHELQLLLWNGNPSLAQAAPPWRPVPVSG
jgi:transposase